VWQVRQEYPPAKKRSFHFRERAVRYRSIPPQTGHIGKMLRPDFFIFPRFIAAAIQPGSGEEMMMRP
jgi:hypothetical protein